MQRIRGLILAVVLAGCSQHQAADEALVAELTTAARATLMALPSTERPGERELGERVELIAAHAVPERIRLVRAGTLTQALLLDDLHATLLRRAADDANQPPQLLTMLQHAPAPWTTGQCLLFDALLHQYQEEAALIKPHGGLETGAR